MIIQTAVFRGRWRDGDSYICRRGPGGAFGMIWRRLGDRIISMYDYVNIDHFMFAEKGYN
jgi:hypothetical protein